jgi:hypothetical protein
MRRDHRLFSLPTFFLADMRARNVVCGCVSTLFFFSTFSLGEQPLFGPFVHRALTRQNTGFVTRSNIVERYAQ